MCVHNKISLFVASFNINSADNARYLLARLLVRKVGKWFRLKDLKYVSELGVEGIEGAIDELCHLSETKHLTSGELSSGGQSIVDSSSAEHKDHENGLMIFAEDETKASMPELLECLNVDELKEVARTMKLPTNLVTVSEVLL